MKLIRKRYPQLEGMKEEDARVHIFATPAVGRDRIVSPTLGLVCLCENPATHLQEVEWASGLIWIRKSEEDSLPPTPRDRTPGRPAVGYPAHFFNFCNLIGIKLFPGCIVRIQYRMAEVWKFFFTPSCSDWPWSPLSLL